MIWALIAAIGLIGFGSFIGAMIHFGHPIKETPIVKRDTAVLICIVPRRYDEVA